MASYYLSNEILLLLSIILFFSSMAIWKFGYLISPLISQSLNLSLHAIDFELSPSQDVLIKKTNDGFYATSFLSIQLRDTTQFKTQTQKTALMEMFERALTSLQFGLKLSFILCNLDLSEHTQKIEERRSLAEHRKSQSSNSAQTASLDREILYYDSQLERLASGERPMQILAYAQTSSTGLTKEEAILRVRSQAKEASAALSNALAANVRVLHSEDLLNCVALDSQPPNSKTHLKNSLF